MGPDPVYDTLTRERGRLGLTETQFAAAIGMGMGKAAVNTWWRLGVPARHHAVIAEFFGWTVDDLLSGGPGNGLTPLARALAQKLDGLRDDPRQHQAAYAVLDAVLDALIAKQPFAAARLMQRPPERCIEAR